MSRRYGPPGGASQLGFPPLARSAMIMIAVNVAIWTALLITFYAAPETYFTILRLGALDPSLVLSGYVHQLATYMFLHDIGSPFHVLFNMLLVYFFAAPIEKRWGVNRTLGFAFGAGVAGGVMVMIFHLVAMALGMAAPSITLGFSGAALGMLAAFCWMHADAQILLFFVLPIKAKYLLPLTIAIDFLMWVTPGGSGISFPAHLGGILFGTLALTDAWLPKRLLMRWRYWKIQRDLKKRKDGQGRSRDKDDKNIVDGPWLH